MTVTPTERRAKLSDAVAEEVRAVMGRQRVSGAELARRLHVSPMWVSYRLGGRQEIGLNDLEQIAAALGVEVAALLPASTRRSLQTTGPKVTPTEKTMACRPNVQPKVRVRPKASQPVSAPQRPIRLNDPTVRSELVTAA